MATSPLPTPLSPSAALFGPPLPPSSPLPLPVSLFLPLSLNGLASVFLHTSPRAFLCATPSKPRTALEPSTLSVCIPRGPQPTYYHPTAGRAPPAPTHIIMPYSLHGDWFGSPRVSLSLSPDPRP
jgi:hypothetical protein